MEKKRILLAMSGGIDSSVAAMILLEQGYELVGVTFRTFDSITESCIAREKGCCSVEAIFEAKHLAEKLGFPHHILDVRDLFKRTVIQDFIDQYLQCRTPNPCVLCNPVIKWGRVLEMADELGCSHIATGHYAGISQIDNRFFLQKGADRKKDQTYFLWKLTSENLARTIFPLGNLTKDEVRQIAADHGFVKLSKKKESEEICFVTDDDYRNFLKSEVPNIEKALPEGEFTDLSGKVIGKHKGLYNYTIGQRKGLGVAMGFPAYVVELQKDTNRVILGTRDDLMNSEFIVSSLNLTKYDNIDSVGRISCKVRYRSEGINAKIEKIEENRAKITLQEPTFAITCGQSAVFYENDDLIGGGIIEEIIK